MIDPDQLRKIYSEYTTKELFKFIFIASNDFEPETLEIIKEVFKKREGEISTFIENEIAESGFIEYQICNSIYFDNNKNVVGRLFFTSKGIYFIPDKIVPESNIFVSDWIEGHYGLFVELIGVAVENIINKIKNNLPEKKIGSEQYKNIPLSILTYCLEHSYGIDIEDIELISWEYNGYLKIRSINNVNVLFDFNKENFDKINNWFLLHKTDLEKEKKIITEKTSPKAKISFSIGKTNKFLVTTACVASITYFIFQKNFTPFETWYLFGFCTSFIIWPYIAGWILWKITKNNITVGKVAFFIVLVMFIFINTLRLTDDYKEKSSIRKIDTILSDLENEAIDDLKQDGQFDANFSGKLEKFGQQALQYFPTRTDEEKASKEVMQEFMDYLFSLHKKSDEAEKNYMSELSSFIAINNRHEINKKIESIKKYRESLVKLCDFTMKHGGSNFVENKLRARGVSEEAITANIDGLEKEIADIRDISIKAYEVRFKFMDSLLNALYFLDKNWGKWEYSLNGNKILFYNDSLLIKFNKLMNIIAQNEEHFYSIQKEAYSIVTRQNQ